MAKIVLPRNLSKNTDSVTAAQGDAGGQAWLTAEQNQLVPAQYNFVGLTYHPTKTDLITQVVYKTGGPSGIVVATLTLTYDSNDNISSVHRT
jgi:hypothetical protein